MAGAEEAECGVLLYLALLLAQLASYTTTSCWYLALEIIPVRPIDGYGVVGARNA